MIALPRLRLAFVFVAVPLAAQTPSAAGGSPARLTSQTGADSAVAIVNVSVVPMDRERVLEQKRAGYDFIKLHGNLSSESYATLNRVARREGIRVIGHAPRNLGVDVMFKERQYALAHAEEFLYDRQNRSTDASLPAVEAKIPEYARAAARAQMWVMPNLTAYKMIARMVHDLPAVLARPEMAYVPSTVRTGWGPATNPLYQPHRSAPLRADDGALPAATAVASRASWCAGVGFPARI